jgi:hypothetical protein
MKTKILLALLLLFFPVIANAGGTNSGVNQCMATNCSPTFAGVNTTGSGVGFFKYFNAAGTYYTEVVPNSGISANSVLTLPTEVSDTLVDLTGSQTLSNKIVFNTSEYSNGTCTTSATIAASNGNRQKITLTNGDACALSFSQPSAGTAVITLKIIQSTTSSYNGTISGCKWPSGTVMTPTATTGATDFISIYLDGTNAYCAPVGQAFS